MCITKIAIEQVDFRQIKRKSQQVSKKSFNQAKCKFLFLLFKSIEFYISICTNDDEEFKLVQEEIGYSINISNNLPLGESGVK